jgi:hypothetical protein
MPRAILLVTFKFAPREKLSPTGKKCYHGKKCSRGKFGSSMILNHSEDERPEDRTVSNIQVVPKIKICTKKHSVRRKNFMPPIVFPRCFCHFE